VPGGNATNVRQGKDRNVKDTSGQGSESRERLPLESNRPGHKIGEKDATWRAGESPESAGRKKSTERANGS